MSEPSVKGSLYQAVALEVAALRESGRVSSRDLEEKLKPEDLEALDGEIAIASWYPIESYARLLRVLCSVEGRGRDEFYVEGGRRSAERLVGLGVYAQLDDHTAGAWEPRIGRSLLSIAPALFNFGRWTWTGIDEKGDFSIQVADSAAMPREVALRAFGFVEYLVKRAAGDAVRCDVRMERTGQDIFFRVQAARRI